MVSTSQNVRLVHVVGAEHNDPLSSPAPEQRPHLVSGGGIHTCRGFIQEEDLWEQIKVRTRPGAPGHAPGLT